MTELQKVLKFIPLPKFFLPQDNRQTFRLIKQETDDNLVYVYRSMDRSRIKEKEIALVSKSVFLLHSLGRVTSANTSVVHSTSWGQNKQQGKVSDIMRRGKGSLCGLIFCLFNDVVSNYDLNLHTCEVKEEGMETCLLCTHKVCAFFKLQY
jgi:hypothetical protein